MFILPHTPSPQADTHELADFAEFLAWENGATSTREVIACLGRVDDNDDNEGCDDDDDVNANEVDDVINEADRRVLACNGGYPFFTGREGTTLNHINDLPSDPRHIIYRFLLLATRINMRDCRIHASYDGSALLEELVAQILRNYLGPETSRSLVFGTATRGTFENRVNKLCAELCEGRGFRKLDDGIVAAKDDKLDAIAWIPFADRLPGQAILFAQCKSGSTWGTQTTQLQPATFIQKWLSEPLICTPMRAFCIAEAADRSQWRSTGLEAGILFDRCRIVNFSSKLDPDLLLRINDWTNSAKDTVDATNAKPRIRLGNKPVS